MVQQLQLFEAIIPPLTCVGQKKRLVKFWLLFRGQRGWWFELLCSGLYLLLLELLDFAECRTQPFL